MSILWLVFKTLGSLFVVACCLRAYLQIVRLHPNNPVSKLTFQMTDWVVLPIRRITPGTGGIDWASLLAAVVLSLLLDAPCQAVRLAGGTCLRLDGAMEPAACRGDSDRRRADELAEPAQPLKARV